MTRGYQAKPGLHWRSLVDSPLLLAAWIAVALVCAAIFEVAEALRRAEVVRSLASASLAKCAAETAALRHLPGDVPGGRRVRLGGIDVTLSRRERDWLLTSEIRGVGSFAFSCTEVPGAAAGAFAYSFSCVRPDIALADGARTVAPTEMPCLDEAQLRCAVQPDRVAALRLDKGIALLTWEIGTEKSDYVFDRQRSLRGLEGVGDLIVVPGNLWIEVGRDPLRLHLSRDLVVVVRGNLYIGRPIVVEGNGRLVLATAIDPGAAAFADVDANGRWSPPDVLRLGQRFSGPVEGSGNVYIGLPGSPAALPIDVGLCVAGELHVGRVAEVAGPVVLAFGVTRTAAGPARLEARGEWSFHVERERIPGFAIVGRPRAGLLVSEAGNPSMSAEEGLYLPPPAR